MFKAYNIIILCTVSLLASTLSHAMAPSSITDAQHKPILMKLFKRVYDNNDINTFIYFLNNLTQQELQEVWPDLLELITVSTQADTEVKAKSRQFFQALQKNIKVPMMSENSIKKERIPTNQPHKRKPVKPRIVSTSASPKITQNTQNNTQHARSTKPNEGINTQRFNLKETTPVLAQRLIDWRNDAWLAQKKQKAKEGGEYEYWQFLQDRIYHRLPDSVIQTIIKFGKPSKRPNETYKDFVDTVYTLKGEIQFENLTNPWNPGKLTQPGDYHVTKGKFDKIYHIGFKATQDATRTLSKFMPNQVPVEWISRETPEYSAVYDKGEGVRHVLYLDKQ